MSGPRLLCWKEGSFMTDAASLVPLYENNDVYLVLDELVTFGRV